MWISALKIRVSSAATSSSTRRMIRHTMNRTSPQQCCLILHLPRALRHIATHWRLRFSSLRSITIRSSSPHRNARRSHCHTVCSLCPAQCPASSAHTATEAGQAPAPGRARTAHDAVAIGRSPTPFYASGTPSAQPPFSKFISSSHSRRSTSYSSLLSSLLSNRWSNSR